MDETHDLSEREYNMIIAALKSLAIECSKHDNTIYSADEAFALRDRLQDTHAIIKYRS